MKRSIVAIVGRPNVGKSTLFNRMIKKRRAIVDDRPGVTRDRLYAECFWNGKEFWLVDTGGFIPRSTETITSLVTQQVYVAIDQSDLVLFLLDTKVGLQTTDEEIASILKHHNKKVIVVANKADSEKDIADTAEFYKLGLGKTYPISSASGRNLGELMDAITDNLPESFQEEVTEDIINVAIVGRSNVGKSSLFNAIIGENRQIVSEIPGTTRDSIDSLVEINNRKFNFIDTAGLRKKSRYPDVLEYYTSLRSIRAMERSDVVLELIDAAVGITTGDIRIAGSADQMGRGLIFTANKWDLVKGVEQHRFTQSVYEKAPMLRYAPVIYTCAIKGIGINNIIKRIIDIDAERKKRISTSELNVFLENVVKEKHPPAKRGRFIKFYYITQVKVKPPTFIFFCNLPKLVDSSYQRYLENKLRQEFGFTGTPILLIFKPRR
ncbi:MAG: ribosome biogenesis GTPase Der [candidate division Zixibacteria bacterium 4484_95]|nr:MAG: ribosome biogenesis GTPase Der [candidate division Zixibacteria bacterium 4484_95]